MASEDIHVIQCPCGAQVSAAVAHTHGRVACPACGRRHLVPARPNPLFRYHADPNARSSRESINDADGLRRRRRSRSRFHREIVWWLLGVLFLATSCAATAFLIWR